MAVWIAISGGKNVGKTSVIEQLIRELKSLDYTVSTIKHTHLSIQPDPPGTDTFRHRQAGAETVVLAGPEGYFLFRATSVSTSIPPSISSLLSESDVVLCEGFYRSDLPKVVIESSEIDEKTTSEPAAPIILRTRLICVHDHLPQLSPTELAAVISYIQSHQKPSRQPAK
jgi:molybdopterin-guanine dinucleotide biosynthesis protein MobB